MLKYHVVGCLCIFASGLSTFLGYPLAAFAFALAGMFAGLLVLDKIHHDETH